MKFNYVILILSYSIVNSWQQNAPGGQVSNRPATYDIPQNTNRNPSIKYRPAPAARPTYANDPRYPPNRQPPNYQPTDPRNDQYRQNERDQSNQNKQNIPPYNPPSNYPPASAPQNDQYRQNERDQSNQNKQNIPPYNPPSNYPPARAPQNDHSRQNARDQTSQIKQNIPKYICSIQYNGNEKCSCVITSTTTVVTAAHCVYEINPNYYQVAVGLNFNKVHNVKESTFKHFEYQYPYFDDLIELTLETPIEISSDTEIVQIPSKDECAKFPYGDIVSIWGPTDKNLPLVVNEIKVKVLNVTDKGCKTYYRNKKLTQTMFCAGWGDGKIDPCKADDGSPLMYNNKLYGVASWGQGCRRPTQASVYVNFCKFAYDFRNYVQESYDDYEAEMNNFDVPFDS